MSEQGHDADSHLDGDAETQNIQRPPFPDRDSEVPAAPGQDEPEEIDEWGPPTKKKKGAKKEARNQKKGKGKANEDSIPADDTPVPATVEKVETVKSKGKKSKKDSKKKDTVVEEPPIEFQEPEPPEGKDEEVKSPRGKKGKKESAKDKKDKKSTGKKEKSKTFAEEIPEPTPLPSESETQSSLGNPGDKLLALSSEPVESNDIVEAKNEVTSPELDTSKEVEAAAPSNSPDPVVEEVCWPGN